MQLLYAQAAWLRCHTGAAFASLKKIPFGFFSIPTLSGPNPPRRTPYVTTGNNLKSQELIALKLKLVLHLKRLRLFLDLTPMRTCGMSSIPILIGTPLYSLILSSHHNTSTWLRNRSSNSSRFLIKKALPSFTNTSAGFRRELKLLLISKP